MSPKSVLWTITADWIKPRTSLFFLYDLETEGNVWVPHPHNNQGGTKGRSLGNPPVSASVLAGCAPGTSVGWAAINHVKPWHLLFLLLGRSLLHLALLLFLYFGNFTWPARYASSKLFNTSAPGAAHSTWADPGPLYLTLIAFCMIGYWICSLISHFLPLIMKWEQESILFSFLKIEV